MLAKFNWLKAKLVEPLLAALNQLTKATQARKLPPFRWLCTGSYRLGLNSQGLRKLARAGLQAPERTIILS